MRNTYKSLSVIQCVPITIYTDMCQQWPSYFEIFWIMQALMFTNLSHETYFISIFNFQPKQRKKVYALHIRDNHDINYINAACWKSLMQSKYMYIMILFCMHLFFFSNNTWALTPCILKHLKPLLTNAFNLTCMIAVLKNFLLYIKRKLTSCIWH